jgi:hypothetical protein
MNTQAELDKLIRDVVFSLHNKHGYRFIKPDGSLQKVTPQSENDDAFWMKLVTASVGFSFGLMGALSLGGVEGTEETLESDLKNFAKCGLIAGFKKSTGDAQVALLVDCTGFSDDKLSQRLSEIKEQLRNFQKYSLRKSPQTWFSKKDSGKHVDCKLILFFTDQYMANRFISIWKRSKWKSFFSFWSDDVEIEPIVYDLIGKRRYFWGSWRTYAGSA